MAVCVLPYFLRWNGRGISLFAAWMTGLEWVKNALYTSCWLPIVIDDMLTDRMSLF